MNFDSELLLNNDELNFRSSINRNTGEIISTNSKGQPCTPHQYAYYKGLSFKVYDSSSVYVAGSLHKYFNDGLHNYNEFTLTDINNALKDLKNRFNLDFKNSILRGLEIGLNIEPPIESNAVLEYAFLHKTKPFEYKYNSDEGKYKQCQHSQYIIKLYNKALHYSKQGYDITKEILRFEIKYQKMEKLNKRGIYTLYDLINKGLAIHKLDLLKEWDNILFYDVTINTNHKRIKDFNNPIYWSSLIDNQKTETFKKHRQQLRQLNLNSEGNYHHKIKELLNTKFDELSSINTRIDPLCIRSIKVKDESKVCLITGFNISMQKEESKLLSHTGIKYYKKYDNKKYLYLEQNNLSVKWWNESSEIKIREIAHNIRNKYYNNQIRKDKFVVAGQLALQL